MLVFIAFGYLAWIAFLLALLLLSGIVWALCNLALGISYLIHGPSQEKRAPAARPAPPQVQRRPPAPPAIPPAPGRTQQRQVQSKASSEIWPKWTPAHRRYVDEELALWQEQFDALLSDRQARLRID